MVWAILLKSKQLSDLISENDDLVSHNNSLLAQNNDLVYNDPGSKKKYKNLIIKAYYVIAHFLIILLYFYRLYSQNFVFVPL